MGQSDGSKVPLGQDKRSQKGPCLNHMYTNGSSLGKKKEELETALCVDAELSDILGKSETWRDSSHNWSSPMNKGLIGKDRKGK